jgi:hypothetical protein
MADLLYDYFPTLATAKEAQKRIRRKGYHAVIRKVFMSDYYVVYLTDRDRTRESDERIYRH